MGYNPAALLHYFLSITHVSVENCKFSRHPDVILSVLALLGHFPAQDTFSRAKNPIKIPATLGMWIDVDLFNISNVRNIET